MNVSKMDRSARRAAGFLKTVANERRLLILCHLAEGEMRVGELETRLEMRQPHLSQHLARLRRDGFVRVRRDGREIFYSIASLEALRVIGLLYEMFCPDGADERPRRVAAPRASRGRVNNNNNNKSNGRCSAPRPCQGRGLCGALK